MTRMCDHADCTRAAEPVGETARDELWRCSAGHVSKVKRAVAAPSPKPETQAGRVLRYIERHGSISDVEAFTRLGVRRLAARIHDLRAEGHAIRTVDERHAGGSHARYYLT